MLQKTIQIPKTKLDFINQLLSMTGQEIYQKHGLKRDETQTFTARFPGNIEMDVRLVICENDEKPYTEAILFQNGCEACCTECSDNITGPWELEHEGETYSVTITPED